MKHLIPIILLTIVFCSCKKDTKCDVTFSSVDVSFSNSWTMKMSINIDSSKIVHVLIDSLYKGKTYYIGTINDSAFCAVNKLVRSALTKNYDKVLGQQAPDAGVSGIEIIARNKKIQTLLLSSHSDKVLDTIIAQLSILRNFNLSKDSKNNFEFSSYDIITPKMEPVKFVPPIIKDDVIEK